MMAQGVAHCTASRTDARRGYGARLQNKATGGYRSTATPCLSKHKTSNHRTRRTAGRTDRAQSSTLPSRVLQRLVYTYTARTHSVVSVQASASLGNIHDARPLSAKLSLVHAGPHVGPYHRLGNNPTCLHFTTSLLGRSPYWPQTMPADGRRPPSLWIGLRRIRGRAPSNCRLPPKTNITPQDCTMYAGYTHSRRRALRNTAGGALGLKGESNNVRD
jgi:hypothetical protein